MECFYCGSGPLVKNGMINNKQRYRCKHCGANQSLSNRKQETRTCKRLAVILYLNGIAITCIARLFAVSHVTVFKWLLKYRLELDVLRPDTETPTTLALKTLLPLPHTHSDQDLKELELRIFRIILHNNEPGPQDGFSAY